MDTHVHFLCVYVGPYYGLDRQVSLAKVVSAGSIVAMARHDFRQMRFKCGICSTSTIFPTLHGLQVTRQGLSHLHRGLVTSCSFIVNNHPSSMACGAPLISQLSSCVSCLLCEVCDTLAFKEGGPLSVGSTVLSIIIQEIPFFRALHWLCLSADHRQKLILIYFLSLAYSPMPRT